MHEVDTPIQGRPVAVLGTRPNGDPERSPKGEQGRTRDTKPILQAPHTLLQTDQAGERLQKAPSVSWNTSLTSTSPLTSSAWACRHWDQGGLCAWPAASMGWHRRGFVPRQHPWHYVGQGRGAHMVKPISTKNFEGATGRAWEGWVAFLDGIDARKLSHTEIARRILDTGLASGWWSQSITVAYEQQIGRRVPGQDCDGAFAVSATKTCAGTLDDVLARWVDFLKDREELGGIAISRGPDTSASEKWRYWRCGLEDGSRVNVTIGAKAPGKVLLAVQHERLETADHVEHWRDFWKPLLKSF